jgi:hypothetical protein
MNAPTGQVLLKECSVTFECDTAVRRRGVEMVSTLTCVVPTRGRGAHDTLPAS